MDFLDELGRKASSTYRKTAEKTAKMAKAAKIKSFMNENKDKIDEIYQNIGKKVYEKHIREESIDIDLELKEECEKIDTLANEIEDFRIEYLRLKDKRQCKNCFCEIPVEAHYCYNCGKKQENDKISDNETNLDINTGEGEEQINEKTD